MSDAMIFPETIEEFIDQYKFIDTDQIYTNGSELIQVFRVMQWVEHERASDAEPIRHGHWIIYSDFIDAFTCSACGHHWLGSYRQEQNRSFSEELDYCPHCGAKMDEVEE